MCKACDTVKIHQLIRSGAPASDIEAYVDEWLSVNERSPCGKSPIMTAAYYCRKDVVAILAERGAVVNAIDEKTGDTAAHYAMLSLCGNVRQSATLMALIEVGADVDMRNYDGYDVFELAAKCGNREVADSQVVSELAAFE